MALAMAMASSKPRMAIASALLEDGAGQPPLKAGERERPAGSDGIPDAPTTFTPCWPRSEAQTTTAMPTTASRNSGKRSRNFVFTERRAKHQQIVLSPITGVQPWIAGLAQRQPEALEKVVFAGAAAPEPQDVLQSDRAISSAGPSVKPTITACEI